jgi:drug/metabolite transporter (DMT)-like permease
MPVLPAIFSLLVAAAGWYYAFYSPAAGRLRGIEHDADNRLRVRLRRTNGVLMILLGATFYVTAVALDDRWPAGRVATLLIVMLLLLLAVGVLGTIDLRLTNKLRRALRRPTDAAPRDDEDDPDRLNP